MPTDSRPPYSLYSSLFIGMVGIRRWKKGGAALEATPTPWLGYFFPAFGCVEIFHINVEALVASCFYPFFCSIFLIFLYDFLFSGQQPIFYHMKYFIFWVLCEFSVIAIPQLFKYFLTRVPKLVVKFENADNPIFEPQILGLFSLVAPCPQNLGICLSWSLTQPRLPRNFLRPLRILWSRVQHSKPMVAARHSLWLLCLFRCGCQGFSSDPAPPPGGGEPAFFQPSSPPPSSA